MNNLYDILVEIKVALTEVRSELSENKKDLQEHMRRTKLLEIEVKRLRELEIWLKGAAITVGGVATLVWAAVELLVK